MTKFKFKAKKITGEEMDAEREAVDQFDLARNLKKEGYVLIDFEEEGEKKKIKFLAYLSGIVSGVSLSEKMIFTRNLGVMLGAGLPLARALDVLIRQAKSRRFKKALSSISESISQGNSLSESMSEYPDIFSSLYTAMIKSGERSGKMQEALKLIAEQMNQDYALRRKIKGAMVYPAIVIIAMIGIAILMLIYVVPTLVSVFEEMDIELPLMTRIVIWLSKSLVANAAIMLGILLVLAGGVYYFLRTEISKKLISIIALRLPFISGLTKKMNSARTARTLSSLASSGVPILEALDITANVIQNFKYKKVLVLAKEKIQKGSNISAAFKEEGSVYPPLMAEMIAVGEESGDISGMLLNLAIFYEEEVSEATKNISTIIEPVLMILIGGVVGFFAIAMMKPMYSMIGGL